MKLTFFVLSLFIAACSHQSTRLWIDPPVGQGTVPPSELRYEVNGESGPEKLSIPLQEAPGNLVIQGKTRSSSEEGGTPVTRADRPFQKNQASLSYLMGLEEVQKLYAGKKYTEALVKIAPLVEEYPEQVRLLTMQGTLYRRIGERKKALVVYQRALGIDKNNVSLQEAVERLKAETGEEG